MTDRSWKLSPETVTAIAAVVTALIALAVGVWDNVQTRRHNRLSVVPQLVYRVELSDEQPGEMAVWLVNEGIGPALVESIDVRFEGDEPAPTVWAATVERLAEMGYAVTRTETRTGFMMGAGREVPVLRFEPLPGADSLSARRVLDGLALESPYASVYGDGFVARLGDGSLRSDPVAPPER